LPSSNEDFSPFGIYEKTASLPAQAEPLATELPLQILASDRIVLIGNTLLERSKEFGRFEAFLQHGIRARHLN